MQCATIKIKSDDDQHVGGFIVINESDFDPDVYELFEGESLASAKPMGIAQMREMLTAKGVLFDPAAKKSDLVALIDAL